MLLLNKLFSETPFILKETFFFVFRVLNTHRLMNLVRGKSKILVGEGWRKAMCSFSL